MQVGLYLNAQHPTDVRAAATVRELVDQVRLARDLSFSTIMAGHHFLSQPYWTMQNMPLLARLAAEAGEMRIGTGIVLLTLLNPVETAENFASLDAITAGHFVAGVGLGYRAVEDAAFGLVGRRRAKVFEAKLDVVRRLLEGAEVTAHGPGFRLECARLMLRPQRVPPIWIAANGDAGVRRAARLGDAWLINPHTRIDELERQVKLFHTVRAESSLPVNGLPIIREVCVRGTNEEAAKVARPYLEHKYSVYVDWGQSEVLPSGDTLRRQWDELASGRFIIGSPDTCVALMREHARRLGVGEILCRVQWPGMPHAEALRSLRLLGEQVLPVLASTSNTTRRVSDSAPAQ